MARKKVYKVKHYKTGFRRRRGNNLFKGLLVVLCCAVIFGLSYLLLGPLTDLIYNNTISSSEASELESQTTSTPQKNETPVVINTMKTRVVSVSELENKENHASLVAEIKSGGFSAVVLPLRTKDYIYFPTQNELALRTATVKDFGIVDLVKSLKAEKIKVLGEFSTFMDDKLPRMVYKTDKVSLAVRAKGDLTVCAIDVLTDPKDEKGITWLSPESKETREYLIDLAKSAAATGVDGIIFTSFNYLDQSIAVFTDAPEFNRAETLKAFSAEIKQALKGTEILILGTTPELKDGNYGKYGGKISNICDDLIITAEKCDDQLLEQISANKNKTFVLRLKECNEETLNKLKLNKNIKYVLIG